jgi:hypothetical protein
LLFHCFFSQEFTKIDKFKYNHYSGKEGGQEQGMSEKQLRLNVHEKYEAKILENMWRQKKGQPTTFEELVLEKEPEGWVSNLINKIFK